MALRSKEWWEQTISRRVTSPRHFGEILLAELLGYRTQLREKTRGYDLENIGNAMEAWEEWLIKHGRRK